MKNVGEQIVGERAAILGKKPAIRGRGTISLTQTIETVISGTAGRCLCTCTVNELKSQASKFLKEPAIVPPLRIQVSEDCTEHRVTILRIRP